MNVCVVGLGKIGLPLAVQIAGKNHQVFGLDIATSVVEDVNRGNPPFPGETDLDRRLEAVVNAGRLSATTDARSAVGDSDVVIIVVPLVVDEKGLPDFAGIDAATRSVGAALSSGTLVVYETTLPVGTTRDRFTPLLEEASASTAGSDFFVAHSPERVFSGRVFADLRSYPKVVGGIDEPSKEKAVAFYESVLDFDQRPDLDRANGVWALDTVEEAELCKLAETTYRDINIAFANELAKYCDRLGANVHEVVTASNSQPFSHIHRPGIAVGGHCIPVYPRFYLAGDEDAALPAAARNINEEMPNYAVEKLRRFLGGLDGMVVAVLGVAYRGGVKETAFSGAFPVVDAIRAAGGTPLVHDPLYSNDELRSLGLEPYQLGAACQAAIVQAEHPEYADLDPNQLPGVRAVLDGRGILPTQNFTRAGVDVLHIGSPTDSA